MGRDGRPAHHGTCNRCGEEVVWCLNASGSYSPPLVMGEEELVLTHENRAVSLHRLLPHTCNPQKRAVHQERQEMIAQSSATAKLMKQEQERAAQVEIDARGCPKCQVRRHIPCLNMSRGLKRGTPIKWPHRERVSDEYAAKYYRRLLDTEDQSPEKP